MKRPALACICAECLGYVHPQTTDCFRASLHYATFVILVLHIGQGTNKVQKAPLNGYWKLQSRPTPEDSLWGSLT